MESKPITFEKPLSTPYASDSVNETFLQNFGIKLDDNYFDFTLFSINNEKIKILVIFSNTKNNSLKKYQTDFTLKGLQKKCKYFNIFEDNFEEFKNDFLNFNKENRYKIISYDDNEIKILINTKIDKYSVEISLAKEDLTKAEHMDYLLKDLDVKDEIINDINLEIKNAKTELKEKENKIKDLEETVNELTNKLDNFKLIKEENEILKNKIFDLEKIVNEAQKLINKN